MKKQDPYIELRGRRFRNQVKRRYLRWRLKHLKRNSNKLRNQWSLMKLIQQTIQQKHNKKGSFHQSKEPNLKNFDEERVHLLPKFSTQLENKSSLNHLTHETTILNSWIVHQPIVFAIKIRTMRLIALHPATVKCVNGSRFETNSWIMILKLY